MNSEIQKQKLHNRYLVGFGRSNVHGQLSDPGTATWYLEEAHSIYELNPGEFACHIRIVDDMAAGISASEEPRYLCVEGSGKVLRIGEKPCVFVMEQYEGEVL